MNRQLKFRILDKLNRNEELLINNLGKIFVIDQGCGQANEADDQENYVIWQYTGLKDKNGKEIYEGDICNAGMVTGPIDFIIGGFSLASNPLIEFLPKDACIFSPDYDPSWIDVEVIGNIFENPELLKINE
jgi:hypothetical protein